VVVTKKKRDYETFPPQNYDSNRPDRDRFIVRPMAEVETRRVEWLWRNRIPFGKITNLEGDPENGKSLLTLTLAALASNGKPFPDDAECRPCGVLLICDEDDYEDTIVPRLIAAGADRSVIYSLHPEKDDNGNLIPFFMPDHLADLEWAINDVKEATGRQDVIVVIDPVSACLSERINSGVDASVRRALSPLAVLARNTSAAILLVRHLNKNSSEKNAAYRGGGSIGFFAAARAVLVVGRDPRDPGLIVMAQGKRNLSVAMPSLGYRIEPWEHDADLPVIVWEGVVDLDAATLLNGLDNRKRSPERDLAKTILVDLLEIGNGVVAAKEAVAEAKGAGISTSTVNRAAEDMGLVRKAVRGEDGKVGHWQWEWPVQGTRVTMQFSEEDWR
jgi:hypothetical protein